MYKIYNYILQINITNVDFLSNLQTHNLCVNFFLNSVFNLKFKLNNWCLGYFHIIFICYKNIVNECY